MKNVLLLAIALLAFSTSYANSSSKYFVNDEKIENVMQESTQIDFTVDAAQLNMLLNSESIQQDKNAWVAFALTTVVGGLGIHRVYLGGKGSLILIYIVTCGGIFGIVPLVDWIVLLVGAINGDISQFVGNDKFFMWGN
jgi:TM2 domain-containing membrane protein YozV